MGIIEAQENIQELNKWIDYFTNLHSQLLMEKNLKMSITQNQKNKEVEIDWALIEKYLVDLNLNGRTGADQQPWDPTTSGLSDSSKSWNVHIPGREPPAEWVSTSGAPCWTPSPTSTVYLEWILLHSVHLHGVNGRKPVSQLIQGVVPFPVLATPLEKQLRWLPLQQQSKRRYRL